ncbi:hypothetical protein HPB50_006719 [Hyalomma asiaticum]|uniref:Uncharacterized protein n=1 Tax=Hyalomma asiaticum TaxID=266040 RepID=A0ACB7RSC0_HYAAI|nr:hypothetical protein HPB50_006719 [Hyalomma asiaticum]
MVDQQSIPSHVVPDTQAACRIYLKGLLPPKSARILGRVLHQDHGLVWCPARTGRAGNEFAPLFRSRTYRPSSAPTSHRGDPAYRRDDTAQRARDTALGQQGYGTATLNKHMTGVAYKRTPTPTYKNCTQCIQTDMRTHVLGAETPQHYLKSHKFAHRDQSRSTHGHARRIRAWSREA